VGVDRVMLSCSEKIDVNIFCISTGYSQLVYLLFVFKGCCSMYACILLIYGYYIIKASYNSLQQGV